MLEMAVPVCGLLTSLTLARPILLQSVSDRFDFICVPLMHPRYAR